MKRVRLHVGMVLTGCFLLIIAIMGINTLVMQQSYDRFLLNFSGEYQQLIRLIDVKEDLRLMYETAASMVGAASNEALPQLEKQYADTNQRAIRELTELKQTFPEKSTMYHHMTDLLNMFDSFNKQYDGYLWMRKNRYELIYLRQARNDLNRLRSYIEDELSSAYALRTLESKDAFDRSIWQLSQMRSRVIALVLAVATLCLIMALLVSRTVTNPIRALVRRMRAFAKTGVAQEPDERKRLEFSETSELVDNFDQMICEIRQKQSLSNELSRQQLDNLEMKSLLQRAELDMLQMQMNPHFLFNTLNAIGALSQIENAPRSGEMVERLSSILRHSMTALTQFVSLESETKVAADYIAIQQTRFSGRPLYQQQIDEQAYMHHIPCMMIQPLIENAIMHAFPQPKKTDEVRLIVHLDENGLLLIVADNGIGMEKDRIEALLNSEPYPNEAPAQRRGIGLDNVIRRMRILYGDGHVSITVIPGQGTRVALTIPKNTDV